MRSWSVFLAYFTGLALFALGRWLGYNFDDPTLDQILYHLYYSDSAGVAMGRIFFWTFFAECLLFPLLFAACATAFQRAASRLVAPRPSAHRLVRGMVLPSTAAVSGAVALMLQLSAFSWIGYHFAEDRFANEYVPAEPGRLTARAPKNLILVYVESLEETYGDARLWGRDLLQPLRSIGGTSFASYRPAPGATWTIAGMVATQCGVPLRVASPLDFRAGSAFGPAFLPGARCLSDILHGMGYRNVFLGGAPSSFAGKGRFLRDHHYDEVYGREEWEKRGLSREAFNFWGLYDEALYAQAKAKLAQLHRSGQPFNLTLLTLDTHNPDGFLSPGCRRRGVARFEALVECASDQLAGFLRFVEQGGYLEDTNVVVIGDHLAVHNAVDATLRQARERRIYNRFIARDLPPKNTEVILPFDLFPSILEFIGIDVEGGRLGLGYSAFNAPDTSRPAGRLDELALPALAGSASYTRLWSAPAAP